MDLNRLRYFTTVAATGSVRRAAELLHLSPAAVSKAIKQLEAELKVKLVVPAGRGILITDAGRVLSKRGLELVAHMAEIQLELADKRKKEGPLRLGSFEVFTTYFMGLLIQSYMGDSELILHQLGPGDLEHALVQNDVDVGITYIPIPTPELEHVRVAKIEMDVFGRRDVFGKTPFDRLPFAAPIRPIRGSPNRVQGLDGWPVGRLPRWVRHQVTLMETALELCRRGLAVAYLPRFVVTLHNAQTRREFALETLSHPPIRFRDTAQYVYLVRRKSDVDRPELEPINRALKAVLGERGKSRT